MLVFRQVAQFKGVLIFYLASYVFLSISANAASSSSPPSLYRWMQNPKQEETRVKEADDRLKMALAQPEYTLTHWIALPTSPAQPGKKIQHLSLREAILLALRYNPNIQNAELDRIIERYELRLAYNQFELQYALAGSAVIERNQYSGVGDAVTKSYLATPELNLRTRTGGQLSLNLDTNVSNYNSNVPVLNFNFVQPLLRGSGRKANEANLLNAIDIEALNKIGLEHMIMDQITQVIAAYRSLILSGNQLKNIRRQSYEAQQSYAYNEKKMQAGQLEPTANIQPMYQLESLRIMVEQAENDFKTAAQELLQAIGLDPNMHLAVPDDLDVAPIELPPLKEAIRLALAHDMQYLAQKMLIKADQRAYEVEKNNQLVKLDFTVNVQTGRVSDVDGINNLRAIYTGENLNESARLTLNIPLNDLNRKSQLIRAKVKLEKDKVAILSIQRAIETRIKNTLNHIRSQAKRLELAKKQVNLAEQAYYLEKKKQNAGIASSLDVNNTQNQLLQAQSGLISIKISYLNEISHLQRLLGKTLKAWQVKLRYCG